MRYTFNSTAPATASCVVQSGTRLCPTGVNYTITEDFENANRAVAHSIFLQDQWTRGRMTLQGALRYDYVYSWAPAEGNGTDQTSRFTSTPIRFPRTDSVTGYNDLSPRLGLAYDLFGNGRTALKVSVGRYLSAATADGVYSSQSPAGNFVRTVTNRPWTDSNGNFAVDCNLLSSAAQDSSASGGDACGAAHRRKPELRQHRSEYDQSRPGASERLGRAAVQLALRRVDSARGASRRLGRRRLQPSSLGQLQRHLQRARQCERLRRLDGSRAEPSRTGECGWDGIVRGDHAGGIGARLPQLPDEGRDRCRRGAHRVLAWRGPERDGTHGQPADAADGDIDRSRRAKHLRAVGSAPAVLHLARLRNASTRAT